LRRSARRGREWCDPVLHRSARGAVRRSGGPRARARGRARGLRLRDRQGSGDVALPADHAAAPPRAGRRDPPQRALAPPALLLRAVRRYGLVSPRSRVARAVAVLASFALVVLAVTVVATLWDLETGTTPLLIQTDAFQVGDVEVRLREAAVV